MEDDWILSQEANHLAQSGVLSGLIVALVKKGVLSYHDAREVYETALLTLETNEALLRDDDRQIFQRARSILEASLRSLASKQG